MPKFIGAVDLGTTSNRFVLFDHKGRINGLAQKEHRQIFPKPGWVEHDPLEIWDNTREVIREVLAKTGTAATDDQLGRQQVRGRRGCAGRDCASQSSAMSAQ